MNPLRRLENLQELAVARTAMFGPHGYRTRYHSDLSPAGWHLGHCVYTEAYWIAQVSLQETKREAVAAERPLYAAELSCKEERGRLPPFETLLNDARKRQREHGQQLRTLIANDRANGTTENKGLDLLRQNYLIRFLIEHYAQHLETLYLIGAQRCRRELQSNGQARSQTLRAHPPRLQTLKIPAGEYPIGDGRRHVPYDNEQPQRRVSLDTTWIARRPVSNAEYLAFIEAGGYRRAELWGMRGWRWRCRHRVEAPGYWHVKTSEAKPYCQIAPDGPAALRADEPVCGLSHFEACAYAAWAGGRLPHEYEWEAAARCALIEDTGRVWEWCGNSLHPYPGFRAYPYDGYSTPYFDGDHYVLRGGSRYTQPELRRPSFRNYYPPDARHLRSGVRLVFSEDPEA